MNQPRGTLTYRRFEDSGEPTVSDQTNSVATVEMPTTTVTVNVEIRKQFQRAMQEEPAWNHMMAMIADVSTKKWKLELSRANDVDSEWFKVNGDGRGQHEVSVFLTLTGPNSLNMQNERDERLVALKESAWGTKNQRRNWFIHRVNGETWEAPTLKEKLERAERAQDGMVTYADVASPSDEMVREVFRDIYGVPDQVDRVVNIMRSAIESEFKFRSHAVLLGKPGCGKSFTLELAQRMFFDPSAVLKIDGTAMTSAGIIDILEHCETMPRFIFIEEIDKADSNAVQVLLGLMDRHGEIRKTTFRKDIQRDCKVCVFATANSFQKIQNMQEGALFSRFGGNFITYTRPSDEMLAQILHRELDSLNLHRCKNPKVTTVKNADGTTEQRSENCTKCVACKHRQSWIDRTLAWCNEWKGKLIADTLDPRFVIDLCLNGKDKLLDNKYFTMIENTSVKVDELAEWD